MATDPPNLDTVTRPRPKVLYVDDQDGNLRVFHSSLRRYAEIRTASSGFEGLKILEGEEYPIVVSDQRMDGMTGSEFLTRVRELYPATVRILLTAHADFNAVVEAINGGQIACFVQKPWRREQMRELLMQSNEDYWSAREEKAFSQEFVQCARTAALGQMTAGFAHELSNLGEKLGMIEVIMERWGIQGGDSPELDILRRGVTGVRSLARTVQKLAGKDVTPQPAEVDLAVLTQEWRASFRLMDQVRYLRRLEFEGVPESLIVFTHARKLELAVLNLVINAAEAAQPGTGEVTITVEETGDDITLHVRDNGPGIAADDRQRIWEPGYSTKAEAASGLGLLAARNMVRTCGGQLSCTHSEPGSTTFSIRIPRVMARDQTMHPAA